MRGPSRTQFATASFLLGKSAKHAQPVETTAQAAGEGTKPIFQRRIVVKIIDLVLASLSSARIRSWPLMA